MPNVLLLRYLQEVFPGDVTQSIGKWKDYPRAPDRSWNPESFNDTMPPEILNVIRKHMDQGTMKFMGKGSSRVVFSIPGGKVLKVAMNQPGQEQNRTEARVAKAPILKPFIAKVFRSDPLGRWLVMEEVHEGATHTFLDVERSREVVSEQTLKFLNKNNIYSLDDVSNYPQLWETFLEEKVITKFQFDLLKAMKVAGIMTGDVFRESHWGTTASGRVVLMDFGVTDAIVDKYY